jgi:hypothetical protein
MRTYTAEEIAENLSRLESDRAAKHQEWLARRAAGTPATATSSDNANKDGGKFRVCPRCGQNNREANFSTNPPYCDDCQD